MDVHENMLVQSKAGCNSCSNRAATVKYGNTNGQKYRNTNGHIYLIYQRKYKYLVMSYWKEPDAGEKL